MNNELLEFITSLEKKYNTQFDYTILPDILSLSDTKLIKMIIPVYFLSTVEDKKQLLSVLQSEYSKFLKKNIQLKFIKDYKLLGLFLIVYMFKNHQRSENLYEVVKDVEEVLHTHDEELVTVDSIISFIKNL